MVKKIWNVFTSDNDFTDRECQVGGVENIGDSSPQIYVVFLNKIIYTNLVFSKCSQYTQNFVHVKSSIFLSVDVLRQTITAGRFGVLDCTLAFGSTGHGFESEHRLFSHH